MYKLASVLILLQMILLAGCGGGDGNGTPGIVCSNLLPVPEPAPAVIPACLGPTTGSITLSGTVEFQRVLHSSGLTAGLDYTNIRRDAARSITVQLVNSNSGAVLASTVTDATGFYTFNAPTNTAVYVRVRAEMVSNSTASWNVRVVDNTRSNALYAIAGEHACTGTINETRDILATHGWSGTAYNPLTRQAGPFAILDTIYQGMQLVTASQAVISFPDLIVNWSINNSTDEGELVCGELGTSFFNPNNNQLYLLGREDNDTDEYDQHVIAHEWSHYLEFNFSRTDSVGGFHTIGDRLDMRVAFGEGYGNALAGIILANPVYKDAIGADQASGFAFSVETEPLVSPGWFSEQSVEQILYDLYDTTNENANGITDNISLGFGPLWNILINEQRNGLPLTSIFSFITALKDNNLASSQEIEDLVNSFSINGTTIDAYGTTETNDPSVLTIPEAVLPVYTDLPLIPNPTNICVTDEFDRGVAGGNSLGIRRFLRFTIPSTGNYRFTASFESENVGDIFSTLPPPDPDIALHQKGLFLISQALGTTETFCQNLTAGDYIMELYDYNLFTPHSNTNSRCFDVSVVTTLNC
jgi:hypothetical protein